MGLCRSQRRRGLAFLALRGRRSLGGVARWWVRLLGWMCGIVRCMKCGIVVGRSDEGCWRGRESRRVVWKELP